MSIAEKILATDKPAPQEEVLTTEVQAVIDSSALKELLGQLPEGWKTETFISERGAKVVYDVLWKTGDENRRVALSVRAERIAFMGDTLAPHFSVVQGPDLTDTEKVKDHFLNAVAHPQILSRK